MPVPALTSALHVVDVFLPDGQVRAATREVELTETPVSGGDLGGGFIPPEPDPGFPPGGGPTTQRFVIASGLTNPYIEAGAPYASLELYGYDYATFQEVKKALPVDTTLREVMLLIEDNTGASTVTAELVVDGVATGIVVSASVVGTPAIITPDLDLLADQEIGWILGGDADPDTQNVKIHMRCVFEGEVPFHVTASGVLGTGISDPDEQYYDPDFAELTENQNDVDSAEGIVPADLEVRRRTCVFASANTNELNLRKNGADVGASLAQSGNGVQSATDTVSYDAADSIGLHVSAGAPGLDYSRILNAALAYKLAAPHAGSYLYFLTLRTIGGTTYWDFRMYANSATESDVECPHRLAGTFKMLSIALPDRGGMGGGVTWDLTLKRNGTNLLTVSAGSGIQQDPGTAHVAATDDVHWESTLSGAHTGYATVAIIFTPD
jgi:hypothetical protein